MVENCAQHEPEVYEEEFFSNEPIIEEKIEKVGGAVPDEPVMTAAAPPKVIIEYAEFGVQVGCCELQTTGVQTVILKNATQETQTKAPPTLNENQCQTDVKKFTTTVS